MWPSGLRDKMSEMLIKRLKENLGKDVVIFLKNDFRFAGKLKDCDDKYLELFDYVSKKFKIININQIRDMEVGE